MVIVQIHLAQDSPGFNLLDPLVVAPSALGDGYVEPDYGAGANTALLDGEARERRGQNSGVMLMIVGKNSLDAFGRGSDDTVRRHIDFAHFSSLRGVQLE